MAYIADLRVRDERGAALETGLDRIMAGLQGFAKIEEDKKNKEIAAQTKNIGIREKAAKLADEQGGTPSMWQEYLTTGKVEDKKIEKAVEETGVAGLISKKDERRIKQVSEANDKFANYIDKGYAVEDAAKAAGLDKFGMPSAETVLGLQDRAKQKRDQAQMDRELLRRSKEQQIALGGKKMSEKGSADGGAIPDTKLPVAARESIAKATSAIKNLDEMQRIMDENPDQGPRRINPDLPVVGQFMSRTPYEISERLVNENVGRLQSQGAINAGEIVTFKKMGPQPGDSPDIKRLAIQKQREFLQEKIDAIRGIKNQGNQPPQPPQARVTDQQINDYAKQYGLTPEKARAIIQKRMGQ